VGNRPFFFISSPPLMFEFTCKPFWPYTSLTRAPWCSWPHEVISIRRPGTFSTHRTLPPDADRHEFRPGFRYVGAAWSFLPFCPFFPCLCALAFHDNYVSRNSSYPAIPARLIQLIAEVFPFYSSSLNEDPASISLWVLPVRHRVLSSSLCASFC